MGIHVKKENTNLELKQGEIHMSTGDSGSFGCWRQNQNASLAKNLRRNEKRNSDFQE